MTKSTKIRGASACVLGGIFAWAFWPTFADIAERWWSNPIYSHGYFVPLFSGYLLWQRRGMIPDEPFTPSWWALPWVIFGAALHASGGYFYYDWVSAASILPVLVGLVLAFGGGTLLRWSWPAIAFLVFMLPLPYGLETSLAYPLQRLATLASTYVLQTIGFAAVAEGNVIIMEASRIGVVQACNGLGMLVTFFAMATAVAMLIRGRFLDRVVIVLSAVPIALVANVIRITAASILTETIGNTLGEVDFDKYAGWLMMPLALGLLWLEKVLLDKLLIEPTESLEAFTFTKVATANVGPAKVQTAKESCPVG